MLKVGAAKKQLGYPFYRVLDHLLFLEIEKAGFLGYGLIIGKARRMGLSYIGDCMTLWNLLFFLDNETAIGAGKEDKAIDLFKKVQKSLENLREEYKVSYRKNKTELKLAYKVNINKVQQDAGIGSMLTVKTFFSDPSAFEGGSYSFFIFEEIGLQDNLIKSYKASEPCFMEGGTQFGVPLLYGCVCAGTKVWNNKGELKNIEDLKQKEGIIGYDGNGFYKEDIIWMKPPAKKPCYRIETTGNNFIECSEDHPLLWSKIYYRGNYNKKKVTFQLAKDILVGDQLMVLNEVPVFGNKSIKDARLLGLLIGDGSYGNSVELSSDRKEISEYVKKRYTCKIRSSHIMKAGDLYERIGINGVSHLLKKHGIFRQTKLDKTLPKDIHTFNKKSISELLGGYYDADGNVYYNKRKNTIRVVLTSISEELLTQVKYELLKLGIGSSLSKEKRNGIPSKGYEGQREYIYRLYVNRHQDVLKFQKEIKFLCNDKQIVLDKILTIQKNGNTIKSNLCDFELNPKNEKGQFFINKKDLQNLRSERVTKVEFIGEQEIYNMHTGYSNTYISNGFVTKQTGGEVDKGSRDMKIIYDSPDSYNMKKLFIPAYMFYPGNDDSDEDDEMERGINFFDPVTGRTNEIEALKHILERRRKASKSRDGYIKEIQSRPTEEAHLFLKTSGGKLNRIILNGQLQRVYDGEKAYTPKRGRLEWVYEPVLEMKLARCQTQKERDKLHIANDSKVKFIEDELGTVYIITDPVNEPEMPYDADIGGTDSYDEVVPENTGSFGCTMAYRVFNGMTKDYNMPVAMVYERGDSSSDDTFYSNSLKLCVMYKMRTLVEYSKIIIINYFEDCGAQKHLTLKPILRNEAIANKGKQTYGVHVKGEMKGIITRLLKHETNHNAINIWFDLILLDLIEYGDGNTDIAMALGMCLITKLDMFDEISDDIEVYDTADILMDLEYTYVDSNGELRVESYSNGQRDNDMDTFDPRLHLEGSEREKYLNLVAIKKQKLKEQQREAQELQRMDDEDPFVKQIREELERRVNK